MYPMFPSPRLDWLRTRLRAAGRGGPGHGCLPYRGASFRRGPRAAAVHRARVCAHQQPRAGVRATTAGARALPDRPTGAARAGRRGFPTGRLRVRRRALPERAAPRAPGAARSLGGHFVQLRPLYAQAGQLRPRARLVSTS
jgi:hypothetical protein